MQTTVTSATPVSIAKGPGKYLLRNFTNTAVLYLEVYPGDVDDVLSSSTGFAWLTDDPPMEVDLRNGWTVQAISAGANQVVHTIKEIRFVSSDVLVTT